MLEILRFPFVRQEVFTQLFDPGNQALMGSTVNPMLSININVSPVIGVTLDTPNDLSM